MEMHKKEVSIWNKSQIYEKKKQEINYCTIALIYIVYIIKKIKTSNSYAINFLLL